MREWKGKLEDVSASEIGIKRAFKLQWWFVLLLLLGLAVAIYAFLSIFPDAKSNFQILLSSHSAFPFSVAYAAEAVPAVAFDPKPIILIAVIGTLLVILIGSVATMLLSTNTSAVASAGDLTKVLLGFFVGVGTKFLGV